MDADSAVAEIGDMLRSALDAVASSDATTRARAEHVLTELGRDPRLMPALAAVATTSAPVASNVARIALAAATHLRLCLAEYRPQTTTMALAAASNGAKEAREALRTWLVAAPLMDNVAPQTVRQLNRATALVVRADYPTLWPNAFDMLVANVRQALEKPSPTQGSHVTAAVDCLYRAVKVMASRRLSRDRILFHEIGPSLLGCFADLYSQAIAVLFSYGDVIANASGEADGNHSTRDILSLLRTVLPSAPAWASFEATCAVVRSTLKAIQVLVIHAFPNIRSNANLAGLLNRLCTDLAAVLALCLRLQAPATAVGVDSSALQKIAVRYGKFYIDVISNDPVGFFMLASSFDVLSLYWSKVREFGTGVYENDEFQAHILLQGVKLMKLSTRNKLLIDTTSRTQAGKNNDEQALIAATRERLREVVLIPSFVQSTIKFLVEHFVCLNARDMESWELDPESYCKVEDADHWEYDVRLCANKLIMDLALQYPEDAFIVMKELLDRGIVQIDVTSTNARDALLFKEAVYHTVGLLAESFNGRLDMATFINSTLVSELSRSDEAYVIIRRRIAWLFGKIDYDELPSGCLMNVFKGLCYLCEVEKDMVVFLSAAQSLSTILNSSPIPAVTAKIQPCLESLLRCIPERVAALEDTQLKVLLLDLLSSTFALFSGKISPYGDAIVSALEKLWCDSGDSPLLEGVTLSVLCVFVKSMGEDSTAYHQRMLPIVLRCCDGSDEQYLHMLDMLELILSLFRNSARLTPELEMILKSVAALFPIIESGHASMMLVETYAAAIALAPQATIAFILTISVNSEGKSCILEFIRERMQDLMPEEAPFVFDFLKYLIVAGISCSVAPMVTDALCRSCLIKLTFETIFNSSDVPIVLAEYIAFFGRAVFSTPEIFAPACEETARSVGSVQPSGVKRNIVQTIAQSYRSITLPSDRVVCCYALLKVLTVDDDIKMAEDSINIILDMLAKVIQDYGDMQSEIRRAAQHETIYYFNDSGESPNSYRRQDEQKLDIGYLSLTDTYGNGLAFFKQVVGDMLEAVRVAVPNVSASNEFVALTQYISTS